MKTQYKQFYRQLKKPQIIVLPKIPVISIKGQGDPNDNPLFEKHISALYQLSYGFRMSYKKEPIDGYYSYSVGPLEGFWSTSTGLEYTQDKSTLTYELFIVQPDFVTEQIFLEYQKKLQIKNDYIKQVQFKYIEEGLSAQILHIGSFDTEPESVQLLESFLLQEGYKITDDSHHEIYLSDFRRVTEDRYKTLIRYQIEKV